MDVLEERMDKPEPHTIDKMEQKIPVRRLSSVVL